MRLTTAITVLGEAMANSREADRLLRQFGLRLRAVRIAAGYEAAVDFAADLGIDDARYRKYERGQAYPPIDILAQVCRLTGKTADFLLFGTSQRTSA